MPTAEGPLVNESQLVAVVESGTDPQMHVVRGPGLGDQHLTAHAQVDDDRKSIGVVTEVEPEILAAPVGTGDGLPCQASGEVRATPEVTPHRSGMQDLDGDDLPSGDMVGEATPNRLDLG
ncbi:hypothetical protein GCM10022238_02930 [Gordonia hankookensis]